MASARFAAGSLFAKANMIFVSYLINRSPRVLTLIHSYTLTTTCYCDLDITGHLSMSYDDPKQTGITYPLVKINSY